MDPAILTMAKDLIILCHRATKSMSAIYTGASGNKTIAAYTELLYLFGVS